MWRAVRDPADSPPLHHPSRPFPRLSCCGSHGLAPARLQGQSISTPPATTAERSPALLAGEIAFPATKAPLAPGEQPSSLVTRPLFSSGAVITHGCSEAREQSHFVSAAKQGPAWLLCRWGSGRRGHPGGSDCRLVLHKDARGHSLRIEATLCSPHVLMFLTCTDSLSTCRAVCLQRSVCGAICKSAKIDFMSQGGPARAGALGPWGPAVLESFHTCPTLPVMLLVTQGF